MNRYLLVIILLAVIVLVGGTTAQATTPRVHALGGAGDYFEDDSGTLRWYGSLGDYGNAVTLDFGHFNIDKGYHDNRENTLSGPSLGFRHDLGDKIGTIAGFWHTNDDDTPTPTLYRNYREDSFSLMYSRLLGTVQFGWLFQKSPKQKRDPESYGGTLFQTSRQLWGLGARWDLSSSAYMDVAADLRSNRETLSWPETPPHHDSIEIESEHGLNVRGRLFLQLGQRTALVPLVEYLTEDRPAPRPRADTTSWVNGHLLRLGCGLNYFPDTDRFLFLAGEWNQGSTTYQGDTGIMEPSWTNEWDSYALQMGWETRYLPWMTLRSSVGYRLTRHAELSEDLDYDLLSYTLGMGFHLPGWDLDAALSQGEPRPVFGDWEWSRTEYSHTWLSVSLRYSY